MRGISTILAPVVLAPSSEWATGYAAQMAARLGSKLIFLHVRDGGYEPGAIEAFLSRSLGSAPQELLILEGDPAERIVQVSQERAAGLIVMPTHAHGKFRRYLLGSVTAKVLHDALCPVLTGVHRQDLPARPTPDIHKMICAVDADPSFAPVIRGAQDFAAMFGSELTAIHAVPAADETSDNRGEVELRQYLFRRAEEKFDSLCQEAGVSIQVSFAGGPVHTVVREAALKENAQLVIIGRGHTQRELGRLRTHAYGIIRSAPCPVLSL